MAKKIIGDDVDDFEDVRVKLRKEQQKIAETEKTKKKQTQW